MCSTKYPSQNIECFDCILTVHHGLITAFDYGRKYSIKLPNILLKYLRIVIIKP